MGIGNAYRTAAISARRGRSCSLLMEGCNTPPPEASNHGMSNTMRRFRRRNIFAR
ncbi:hypothetical protein AURDEDRAFT_116139 [Auricularia subglabra TFB-10046 SS5]|nr:hypothetical protein AURDEDRAFT_116139 [Auricularia subglabra TFB-10046 SS5]